MTMSCFTQPTASLHTRTAPNRRSHRHPSPLASLSTVETAASRRNILLSSTVAAASLAIMGLQTAPEAVAAAQGWGTRSFILERYFQPGLSPEDAVARIRQTAEGLHSMRHMVDTMSWRYIIFYIRLKSAYLNQDLKNAVSTVPESQRKAYITKANELVDNMSEFDSYVRTPKVYESYIYYEKTLKSIDDLVALLA